jgi:hypothetical protein
LSFFSLDAEMVVSGDPLTGRVCALGQ